MGISGNKGKSLGNKLNGMQLFCASPSVCTTDRFDKVQLTMTRILHEGLAVPT